MPPAGSGAGGAGSNPETPQPHHGEPLKSHSPATPTLPRILTAPPFSNTSQPHCVDTPKPPQPHHPKILARQCHTAAPGAWDPAEGQADPLLSQKLQPGENAGPEPSRRWDSQGPKIRIAPLTPKNLPGTLQHPRGQGLGETPNLRGFCQNGTFQFLCGYCNLKHLLGFSLGIPLFSSFRGTQPLSSSFFLPLLINK